MNSLTTRPATEWTAPSTVYQVGTATSYLEEVVTQHEATDNSGLSTASGFARSSYSSTVAASSRTAYESGQTFQTTSSESGDRHSSPADAGDFSRSYYSSNGATFKSWTTQADSSQVTSRASSAQTSTESSISYFTSSAGSHTASPGGLSSTLVGPSTTLRTASGTATTVTTETAGWDSITTTASTDGVATVFTTAYSTRTTSTTADWSSTWTTTHTTLTSANTTLTTIGTASQTWTQDVVSTNTATTNPRTDWLFDSILQDTVYLMSANRNAADFNCGQVLWTFSQTALPVTATTEGVFTDLFGSITAQSVTVSDFSKFSSTSAEVSKVTISLSTSSASGTAGNSYYTTTFSNGSSYAITAVTTTTYSASYSLGDVSSTISTWTSATTTDTNQPPATASSTIFTHSIPVTGYATADSAFSATTTTATWGDATSGSTTRSLVHSSTATTALRSSRAVTTDSILIESFTTTGTGTGTVRVLLGSVSTTSLRVYSTEATFTQPTYHPDLVSTVSQFVRSDHQDALDLTATRSDDMSVTRWTESRLNPRITARPTDDNMPALNEVRHQCHPFGVAGFGGIFTVSDLSVYLTTTQGMLSGSTFEEATLTPPSAISAIRGVSFHPVLSSFPFGGTGNAAASSLISAPSAMTGEISLALTWTSTTTTGPATSDTAITSALATHTLAVTSSISGQFWTAETFSINSNFRTEFPADPGGTASGGFVAGDNILGSTYQVLARAGCLRWTEYTGSQSTAAATASFTGSNGSVSTTLASSKAIVFTLENVLSASWSPDGNASAFSSGLHFTHQTAI